ncbi:MAG: presenilin family intramembrane aspartyl protease PSH [Halobacteriaceae archaeon]
METNDGSDGSEDELNLVQLIPIGGVYLLFLLTVFGGILLAPRYATAGLQAFEDPSNVAIPGFIFLEIIIITGVFILALKYDFGETAIRVVFIAIFLLIIHTVFAVILPIRPIIIIALLLGIGVVLWVYPEWYVLDITGVIGGASMIALFGISLAPLPILLLLVIMALYDAYSVYISGHMKQLAQGVGDLKIPMVFVVPPSLSYSILESDNIMEDANDKGVAFLGLGDAFFPGTLIVSAGHFIQSSITIANVTINAPAAGAFIGSLLGMVLLQILANKIEGVHAGLPALNGSVIGGYLIAALLSGVSLTTALGLHPFL